MCWTRYFDNSPTENKLNIFSAYKKKILKFISELDKKCEGCGEQNSSERTEKGYEWKTTEI